MIGVPMKCMRLLVGVSFLIQALSACSVKEARDSCPCLLILDFGDADHVSDETAELLVMSDEEDLWSDDVNLSEYSGRDSLYVPRERLHVRCWACTGGLSSPDGLCIPLGQECPEVYMHDSDPEIKGETHTEKIVMRKNHCVMTVNAVDGEPFPFGFKIIGNVSGYDRYGKPLPGLFECVAVRGENDSECRIVIPRQTDSSLMLQVEGDGDDVKVFALGQYLEECGYDWTAPDLEDVSVTIDYALTVMRLIVKGWESVYEYKVVM